MTAAERKVYEAVHQRSLMISDDGMEYSACEYVDDGTRCAHNGTKYPLQMAHRIPKGQGGETTEDNVYVGCLKHHFEVDHHERIAG